MIACEGIGSSVGKRPKTGQVFRNAKAGARKTPKTKTGNYEENVFEGLKNTRRIEQHFIFF